MKAMTTVGEQLLAVSDVAKILRMDKQTVYKMIWARDIPHRRIGRRIRFTENDLSEYLDGCRV